MPNKSVNALISLPKLPFLALCLILTLIIGIIDYQTGDLVITAVYVIPIYLVAKQFGSIWCLVVTVLSIIELVSSVFLLHDAHISFSDMYFLDAATQSLELLFVGFSILIITKLFK
jgi:hypothetical protein